MWLIDSEKLYFILILKEKNEENTVCIINV